MPNPNISSFISNFGGGGARPNRYEVIMTFPGGIPVGNASNKLAFLCSATTIPSSVIPSIPVYYMGRAVKVAGDREFEDWNITVLNDTDFAIRRAFELWLDAINGHESNVSVPGWSNPRNYYGFAIVNQLGRAVNDPGNIKSYSMQDVLPVSLSDISLGYDQNNTIETYSVTFSINYWSSDTTS